MRRDEAVRDGRNIRILNTKGRYVYHLWLRDHHIQRLLLNHKALNLQLLTILRVGSRALLLFHVSQLN